MFGMHQAHVHQHCYQHLVHREVRDHQESQSLKEKMYQGYGVESQLWKEELEVQDLVEEQLSEVWDCDGLLGGFVAG